MKEAITDDFANIVSYGDFELVQPGRSSDKPDLKFKEKFTLGDMVKKAGPNYAADVSSLIGTQVDIKSDEKKRDYDVYLNYPKTLDYTITMKIPSGYKVEGLEGLKFNVTNNTGSFVSDAKVEGDKITITAKKIYKTSLIKKEDWSKMVDFLDAGFNFSKKKNYFKESIRTCLVSAILIAKNKIRIAKRIIGDAGCTFFLNRCGLLSGNLGTIFFGWSVSAKVFY